ncbi:hypothetical protein STEG23_020978, partial [Scotinomys teguina]
MKSRLWKLKPGLVSQGLDPCNSEKPLGPGSGRLREIPNNCGSKGPTPKEKRDEVGDDDTGTHHQKLGVAVRAVTLALGRLKQDKPQFKASMDTKEQARERERDQTTHPPKSNGTKVLKRGIEVVQVSTDHLFTFPYGSNNSCYIWHLTIVVRILEKACGLVDPSSDPSYELPVVVAHTGMKGSLLLVRRKSPGPLSYKKPLAKNGYKACPIRRCRLAGTQPAAVSQKLGVVGLSHMPEAAPEALLIEWKSFGIGNCRDTTAVKPSVFPQTRSGAIHQPELLQPEHLTFFTAPPLSGCYTSLLGAQPPSGGQ